MKIVSEYLNTDTDSTQPSLKYRPTDDVTNVKNMNKTKKGNKNTDNARKQ